MWVTRQLIDDQWHFTKFNGWLIAEETKTTNSGMADILTDIYRNEVE